jgi:hypothetical protein
LGVLETQETFCIIIAGLFERDSFDLFLPEFDKPWVIHLRETRCYSTNLYTWRPNTVYKNRRVRRHHPCTAHRLWQRLDPLCAHAISEVVVQEQLLGRPHLCALRPYQALPCRSGGVIIREGHTGSSSAPPHVKKEAPIKKEVKDEPGEMPASEEDERPWWVKEHEL